MIGTAGHWGTSWQCEPLRQDHMNNNNNNNNQDICGAVIMLQALQEFIQFIW